MNFVIFPIVIAPLIRENKNKKMREELSDMRRENKQLNKEKHDATVNALYERCLAEKQRIQDERNGTRIALWDRQVPRESQA